MSALPQDWLMQDKAFLLGQVRFYQASLTQAKKDMERTMIRFRGESSEQHQRHMTAHCQICLSQQIHYWFLVREWEERLFWLTKGHEIMGLALQKFEPVGSLQINSLQDMMNISGLLAQSGYFKDASDPAKAAAKVMYGMELGISPIVALQSIYFFEGKPSISAQLLAGLVEKSGKYTYNVVTMSDQECVIEYFKLHPVTKEWTSRGLSTFSMKDAQVAGLTGKQNWKNFPRNMMFARAMSNGVKMFCPDIFMGPIYTEGEIGEYVNVETGELLPKESLPSQIRTIESTPVPQMTQAGADALQQLPPAQPTAGELKARYFLECDKYGVSSKDNKIALLNALYGATPDKYTASVYSTALGRTSEEWRAAVNQLFAEADPNADEDVDDHVGEEDTLPGMVVPAVSVTASGGNTQVA